MRNSQAYLEIAIKAALQAGEKTLKFYHSTPDVIIKDDNSPLTLADLESNKVINEALESTGIPLLSEENKIASYKERKPWKIFWLIDPLDGTKEFINKRSEYTVNIALVEKGIPVLGVVYAPVLNLLYYGTKKGGSYKVEASSNEAFDTIVKKAQKLSCGKLPKKINVVGSRSHLSKETEDFIEKLNKKIKVNGFESYGSSLKLCMIAEGVADIYPRLGPTMEWDTAASHAVALYAGSKVIEAETGGPLVYNKENLLNPHFIVYHPALESIVHSILKVK